MMNEEQQKNAVRSQVDFANQVAEGVDNGVWMGVIWTVDPLLGSLTTRKTTSNFPVEKYLQCLFLLKELLEKEIGLHVDSPTPLRIAPQFQERVNSQKTVQPYAIQPDLNVSQADEKIRKIGEEFIESVGDTVEFQPDIDVSQIDEELRKGNGNVENTE